MSEMFVKYLNNATYLCLLSHTKKKKKLCLNRVAWCECMWMSVCGCMLVNRMFSILYEKAWQLLAKLVIEKASSFTSLKAPICIDLTQKTDVRNGNSIRSPNLTCARKFCL